MFFKIVFCKGTHERGMSENEKNDGTCVFEAKESVLWGINDKLSFTVILLKR